MLITQIIETNRYLVSILRIHLFIKFIVHSRKSMMIIVHDIKNVGEEDIGPDENDISSHVGFKPKVFKIK